MQEYRDLSHEGPLYFDLLHIEAMQYSGEVLSAIDVGFSELGLTGIGPWKNRWLHWGWHGVNYLCAVGQWNDAPLVWCCEEEG